jgi:cell division protein FtsI (penicillin-binding protein 3)
MRDAKSDILFRVYLLYIAMLLFGVAIIVRMVYIQFRLGDDLLQKAEQQELRMFDIEATRGNILASDGSLLATSVPVFEIRMDVASPLIDDAFFNSRVDTLAGQLAILFQNKTKNAYASDLRRARREGNRYLIIKNRVSYAELQQLRKFAILNRGTNRGGLIAIPSEKREKPFRELASRTIGYENSRENIFVGIEGAYNETLKGIDGKQLKRRINNGDWKPIFGTNEVEPQNGRDILTTIDVNLQDVAESALRRNLTENNAYQGCAILMEVSTGHIKAIANLTYDSSTRRYSETYNYAIAESVEPGSTFKLASMMVLLEDKKVKLSDSMDIGRGPAVYFRRVMRDVYPIRDGKITVREAFQKSSNVAISKLVYEAYKDNPAQFADRLQGMMLGTPLQIDIPGEGRPYIKHPSDKRNWYGTSLPWMSIGYELTLTPLQILTFYNAVANNGKMVKPIFVNAVRQGGITLETFETQVIHKSIASQATIDSVKSLMEGVVQSGTARQLRSSPFRIAGKTGTAQIASGSSGYNKQNYNASFVGYFPANNPKYTCIVVVNNPSAGRIYGGAVSAPVFKEIADKVYATRLDIQDGFQNDTYLADIAPLVGTTNYDDLQKIYSKLGYVTENLTHGETWAKPSINGQKIQIEAVEFSSNSIPNVTGMSARDAIFMLENLGLKAVVSGRGQVAWQSLKPGTTPKKGELIELRLRSL